MLSFTVDLADCLQSKNRALHLDVMSTFCPIVLCHCEEKISDCFGSCVAVSSTVMPKMLENIPFHNLFLIP